MDLVIDSDSCFGLATSQRIGHESLFVTWARRASRIRPTSRVVDVPTWRSVRVQAAWPWHDAGLVRDMVGPAKAKLSCWGQGEIFHCSFSGSVMILGPSRKETFLNSRGNLKQASFGELARVIVLVEYWPCFWVGPCRRAGSSASVLSHPTVTLADH